jgi:hypothetical protein
MSFKALVPLELIVCTYSTCQNPDFDKRLSKKLSSKVILHNSNLLMRNLSKFSSSLFKGLQGWWDRVLPVFITFKHIFKGLRELFASEKALLNYSFV